MNKSTTGEFISLLQNEQFVRLVRECDEPEKLTDRIAKEFSGSKDEIRRAIAFIRVTAKDDKQLLPNDYQKLLQKIEEHRPQRAKRDNRKILSRILQAGAAAAILLLIAGLFHLFTQTEDSNLEQFAQKTYDPVDQSAIFLPDGSRRLLKFNDSYIEYSNEQQIIVLKKDSSEAQRINKKEAPGKNQLNRLEVPYGQKQTIVLGDGTMVELNAGSSLTFPTQFSGNNREVYLRGEGFFQVKSNPAKPFVVKTRTIHLTATGTSFNITAYEDESAVSAILVEGVVKVGSSKDSHERRTQKIKPGEGYFLNPTTGKSVVRPVRVEDHIAWRNGIFIFKEQTLRQIVQQLKRYYNHPVKIQGEISEDIKVTGKLDISGNLEQALQYLSKAIEGRYLKLEGGIFILTDEKERALIKDE